jgi:hypothetical protein
MAVDAVGRRPYQVEHWFALIIERVIRRGSFSSVLAPRFRAAVEQIARIEQFVAAYSKNTAPFTSTATADSILEKIQRLCSRISGTVHSLELALQVDRVWPVPRRGSKPGNTADLKRLASRCRETGSRAFR